MHLTHEDKITLGQCFNLAHNEMIKLEKHIDDSYLIKRTVELWNVKNKAIQELRISKQIPIK